METMNDNWIETFKGQRVTVLTVLGSEERNDTGAILEIGGGWVQIAKDNGDMILIPSTAIRVIKLLAMTRTTPGVERSVERTFDHKEEAISRTEIASSAL